MINEVISDLDKLINVIKAKDNSKSFSPFHLLKFEFTFFLTMDIVRYELLTSECLSNITSDAISQLFVFQCFEFYYRDFPEVHKKCSELYNTLSNYNEQLKNHDLPGDIGVENKNWIEYFNRRVSNLI